MNSYPNSDFKQCTESKLGWVHSAHTQNPGCGRCCAHSKLVARMSRAQPAQVARSACVGRPHSAQAVGTCRDLPSLSSPNPSRDIVSKSRPPGRVTHVATSIWCRDTTQATLGRDLQTGSRHHFSCPAPKQGRDFIHPGRDLLELHLCRDIVPMSRPRSCP